MPNGAPLRLASGPRPKAHPGQAHQHRHTAGSTHLACWCGRCLKPLRCSRVCPERAAVLLATTARCRGRGPREQRRALGGGAAKSISARPPLVVVAVDTAKPSPGAAEGAAHGPRGGAPRCCCAFRRPTPPPQCCMAGFMGRGSAPAPGHWGCPGGAKHGCEVPSGGACEDNGQEVWVQEPKNAPSVRHRGGRPCGGLGWLFVMGGFVAPGPTQRGQVALGNMAFFKNGRGPWGVHNAPP